MCAHAYNIRKWRPTQQTATGQQLRTVLEFIAMKTLSGSKSLCCDKHQFCDKMTVNT